MSKRIAGAVSLGVAAFVLQGNIGLRTNLDARLLAAHNLERSSLGLPKLQWDDSLAASAEEWGEQLAAIDDIEHSPDDPDDPDPEGENLFLGTKNHFAPEEMVGMWIEEKKHFKPGIFPNNSRTGSLEDVGHYTQLVWRDTGRVGCAVSQGQEYDILVCRYRRAGNVEGERPF